MQINSAGQVVLKLKTAWRDGITHIVMSPLEFMQRLAARANEGRLSGTRAATGAAPDPLPRRNGALAPNAKLRALVVPQAPEDATGESAVPATESGCTHSRPARISWARLRKRVLATT